MRLLVIHFALHLSISRSATERDHKGIIGQKQRVQDEGKWHINKDEREEEKRPVPAFVPWAVGGEPDKC